MGLSTWQATQSDGTIANTPATCFRYKYEFDTEVDLTGESGIVNRTIEGRWKVRLYVPPAETGEEIQAATIWQQEVITRYQLVALVFSLFGRPILSFGTWYIASEQIKTSICGHTLASGELARDIAAGETTIPLTDIDGTFPSSGPAWIDNERISYTAVDALGLYGANRGEYAGPWVHGEGTDVWEAPATVGAEVGAADPASGNDFSDSGIHIMSGWMSPVYQLTVPAGTRVKIDFHNVGFSSLAHSVSAIQTQTCSGRPAAVRDPMQGVAWIAAAGEEGVAISSLIGKATGPFSAVLPAPSGAMQLLRSPTSTRLALLYQRTPGVVYTASSAEGQEGTWDTVAIVDGGMELVTACLSQDGGMFYMLANLGGDLHMYHVALGEATPGESPGDADTYAAQDLGVVSGLSEVQAGDYMVEQSGKLHLIAGADDPTYYCSEDGGLTWQ